MKRTDDKTTTTPRKRWRFTTVRQWGGDDGCCWAVFVPGQDCPVVSGLTKSELGYYRERIESMVERERGCEACERLKLNPS